MKISEAADPFFTWAEVERQYARQTVAKLRDCFAAWILPRLGHNDLEVLDRGDVLRLREIMVGQELSIARQLSVISALKAYLYFCRTVLHVKCLDGTEIRLPKRPKPQPEALTDEELTKLRQAIAINTTTGLRLRALVELLAETGMRIGEALALDRKPFETGQTEIEILGKGSKPRTVFITEPSQFWVRQYLARRVDQHPALFVTKGTDPKRWAQVDVSPCFIQLRRTAKIEKKVTPHLLRHTFCTNLRNNGADISLIQQLAGHADIETTARYYLKTDKAVLRQTVKKYLNYEQPLRGSHT